MICLSCGSAFVHPITLDDDLGFLIQICPKCRSADLYLSDGSCMPGKEAPRD